jgi:nitrous oxidase accessory protein NosD
MGPRYYMDSLTAGNFIYHNNFLDFAWNQTRTTPVNVWSSNMQGNYWADYNGVDANHDGVGDTPYIIDKTNTDKYPLMQPVNLAVEPIPK